MARKKKAQTKEAIDTDVPTNHVDEDVWEKMRKAWEEEEGYNA